MGSFWDDLDSQWNVAQGVRDSGVAAVIQDGLGEVRDGVDGLASAAMAHAAVSEQGFGAVCTLLARQSGVLERVETILGNPKSTQADELFRRGQRALRAGWLEEAAKELAESVELDPYAPQSQLALGIVKGALNDPIASGQAFARAVRYSSDNAHLDPLAAGAGVLGCRAFVAASDLDSAGRLLHEVRGRIRNCPELELLAGQLLDDKSAVERAFNLAPELIPLAFRQGTRSASEAFASSVSGGTLKAVGDSLRLWEQIGGPHQVSMPTGEAPESAAHWYVHWANELVPRMRVSIGQRQSELNAARVDLAAMESRAKTASGWDAQVARSRVEGLHRRVSRHEPPAMIASQLEASIRTAMPPRMLPLTEASPRAKLSQLP